VTPTERILSQIQQAQKLSEGATAGPWEALPEGHPRDRRCDGIYGPPVAEYKGAEPERARIVETDSGYYPPKMPDALFIAASRTLVPRLARQLEEAVKALEEIRTNGDYRLEGYSARAKMCEHLLAADEALSRIEQLCEEEK